MFEAIAIVAAVMIFRFMKRANFNQAMLDQIEWEQNEG